MNAKLSALITAAALLLAACGTSFNPQARPQLDVGESRRFKIERLDGAGGTEQVSLLVVRWIQTDAFGAPLARLSATERGWRRDGFVPPNHAAQALFTEMFPLLKDYSSDERDININAGGVKWRVTPLPPENGDE